MALLSSSPHSTHQQILSPLPLNVSQLQVPVTIPRWGAVTLLRPLLPLLPTAARRPSNYGMGYPVAPPGASPPPTVTVPALVCKACSPVPPPYHCLVPSPAVLSGAHVELRTRWAPSLLHPVRCSSSVAPIPVPAVVMTGIAPLLGIARKELDVASQKPRPPPRSLVGK